MARQIGTTTKQMEGAPVGAVFVWVHGNLTYPKTLAREIGREDLEIVGPSWFSGGRWRNREITGLIVDHACWLTEEQHEIVSMVVRR